MIPLLVLGSDRLGRSSVLPTLIALLLGVLPGPKVFDLGDLTLILTRPAGDVLPRMSAYR